MNCISKGKIIARVAALTALLATGFGASLAGAADTMVVRWGESLAANHPQVIMAERVAKEVKEKTNGRIDIQVFPNSQLGSGKEMVEMVSSGALQMVTEGAGAVSAFLPALSVIEAPYLWRDPAHMSKLAGSPFYAKLNDDLVAKRGMRMLNVTYYGKRHLTTGNKAVKSPADMSGFKVRVPPVDVFRSMAEAWGARATPIAFGELYLALSQGVVDGQENPLPTIESAKLYEVQKYLVLTGHILTPRIVIANEAFLKSLAPADRTILQNALAAGEAWQNKELQSQEATLVNTLKGHGMTVIDVNVEQWRKPVLDTVPKKYEEKWGKGTFEALLAL
jgi:tripartite ATP-independent transporter DctP family solute receptor